MERWSCYDDMCEIMMQEYTEEDEDEDDDEEDYDDEEEEDGNQQIREPSDVNPNKTRSKGMTIDNFKDRSSSSSICL